MNSDNIRRQIVESVDGEELTKLCQEMVRIPSVCGEEKEVALFVAQKMRDHGLETTVDEILPRRPNVYGLLRGKVRRPTLMYNGHLDVVPPGEGWTADPYSGLVRDRRLYGRGSADMKGPLASMMIAARALETAKVELKGDLVITAVIGEEENQIGTRRVVDKKMEADFAVVGEPTALMICTAHKGDVDYEITTAGKAAHASVPHEGINAIYKMNKVVEAIEKFADELEKGRTHPLLGNPTISVGTIQGGTISAAVPAFCRIRVDRRTLPDETGEDGKKQLETLMAKLRDQDADFSAQIRIVYEAPPMQIREDENIIEAVKAAVLQVTGKDPRIGAVPYTTDGGILVNHAHIPTVVFGPGDITQAHQPNESISVDEMATAAKIYALTALNLLS